MVEDPSLTSIFQSVSHSYSNVQPRETVECWFIRSTCQIPCMLREERSFDFAALHKRQARWRFARTNSLALARMITALPVPTVKVFHKTYYQEKSSRAGNSQPGSPLAESEAVLAMIDKEPPEYYFCGKVRSPSISRSIVGFISLPPFAPYYISTNCLSDQLAIRRRRFSVVGSGGAGRRPGAVGTGCGSRPELGGPDRRW